MTRLCVISWFCLRLSFFLCAPTVTFADGQTSAVDPSGGKLISVIIRDRSMMKEGKRLELLQSRLSRDLAEPSSNKMARADASTQKQLQAETQALSQRAYVNIQSKLKSVFDRSTDVQLGRFKNPALSTLTVNSSELALLESRRDIDVFLDRWHTPMLDQSVPLVFPDQASAGFNGNGTRVALLDTGVNASHTFLVGAVAQNIGACFSTNDRALDLVSLCPNGQTSQIGIGAGSSCDSTLDLCGHGTAMAGIMVGSSVLQNGVATGAQVVPIQIFSRSDSSDLCAPNPAPCIGSLSSDLIRALEYVQTIVLSQDIVAVNISMGSGLFQGVCDIERAPEKTQIDNLVSLGVPVITASGNNGSMISMSSPACISTAISVASTDLSDTPNLNNNRNSTLDFFAPGDFINTSALNDDDPLNDPDNQNTSFANISGTSAAAAHVSGAWGVLASKNSVVSVNQLRNILTDTGVGVTQSGIAGTKPRINLSAALTALPESSRSNEELCFPIVSSSRRVVVVCL